MGHVPINFPCPAEHCWLKFQAIGSGRSRINLTMAKSTFHTDADGDIGERAQSDRRPDDLGAARGVLTAIAINMAILTPIVLALVVR